MQRITITIEDDLLAEIDAAAEARGYQNRSEIIRDLARAGLQQGAEDAAPSGQCVAALVYVYDHAARDLSKRLVQNFHGHHDLSLATLHVHLDDDSCMEVTALKGGSGEVRHFADHIIAERGVRYGRVVMIPTASDKKPKARKQDTARLTVSSRYCERSEAIHLSVMPSGGLLRCARNDAETAIAHTKYLSERPITAISSAIFSR